MLLGTAATSEFVLRYLIPVVPLLVCGGVAACADLAALERAACSCRSTAGRNSDRRPALSVGPTASPQRGSKNSTAPTTTIAAAIAISVGESRPPNRISTPVTNSGNPAPIARPAGFGLDCSGKR